MSSGTCISSLISEKAKEGSTFPFCELPLVQMATAAQRVQVNTRDHSQLDPMFSTSSELQESSHRLTELSWSARVQSQHYIQTCVDLPVMEGGRVMGRSVVWKIAVPSVSRVSFPSVSRVTLPSVSRVTLPSVSRVTLPSVSRVREVREPPVSSGPVHVPSSGRGEKLARIRSNAGLVVIRRRKMRKHKLKKLRKKMYHLYAKLKQRRMIRKEKNFISTQMEAIKQANTFSAEQYVKEILEKSHTKPASTFYKGHRLPYFIIKEKLGIV